MKEATTQDSNDKKLLPPHLSNVRANVAPGLGPAWQVLAFTFETY
jgi:hypothetical protein